ncbi:lymphocyte antigen 6 complex locus protein G6d-like [Antennarius striatus]|uniref:lymphocyte antigen 6 complex locus protein G6d-like n=1 Tax=Antennarius striatus TaxID=241820 RepID=UPI0035AF8B9E
MGKVLIGVFAVIASLMLVESLVCNNCRFSLLSFCIFPSEETCGTNTSVCFTGKATFPAVSTSVGFNTLGCREPSGCNQTTNGTIMGVVFQTQIECCSTDLCNPVSLSSATTSKMTFTAVIGAAVLASAWGTMA